MTTQEFEKTYWRYYLLLEKKFENTLTYVTLSKCNFKTFSNEYAHLIQSVGAELDSFFKVYCGFAPTDRKTIVDYANIILVDWPEITNQSVRVEDFSVIPFEHWDINRPAQSLLWWDVFDKIKHNRIDNEREANLKNTTYILAALYMIEMKFFKKLADANNTVDFISEKSNVFLMENWATRYISMQGAFVEICK